MLPLRMSFEANHITHPPSAPALTTPLHHATTPGARRCYWQPVQANTIGVTQEWPARHLVHRYRRLPELGATLSPWHCTQSSCTVGVVRGGLRVGLGRIMRERTPAVHLAKQDAQRGTRAHIETGSRKIGFVSHDDGSSCEAPGSRGPDPVRQAPVGRDGAG